MGSGRGSLWQYAAEVYLEYNLVEKVIGTGQTETLKRMSVKKGSGVVPHNGFLQILLINGLLGFLCLLFLIKNIFKLAKRLTPKYKTLIIALLMAYIIMCLFQSYDLLYVHVLIIIAIIINVKKSYLEHARIEFKGSNS